jgi:hypothetical protein
MTRQDHPRGDALTARIRPYLDQFATEYRLTEADLRNKIRARAASFWIGGGDL